MKIMQLHGYGQHAIKIMQLYGYGKHAIKVQSPDKLPSDLIIETVL